MSGTAASAEAGRRIVQFDCAAGAPLAAEVREVMLAHMDAAYGNPSSMCESGRRARKAVEESRASVAEILECLPEEIIFTGSGTESDNMAILGVARACKKQGDHIIVSAIEHPAVLAAAEQARSEGFSVSILPVDTHGRINVEECLKLVTPQTILVSFMYANNEIGTIEPIAELAAGLRKYRSNVARSTLAMRGFPLFHTDACQAAGFLPLDVRQLGVDLVSLNGSKIGGPKGVGVLYKKKGIPFQPLAVGGGQELGLRAGTENVPAIAGFAAALRGAQSARVAESVRLSALRDHFISEILVRIPGSVLNGHPHLRLPNNVHVSIPDVEGESLVLLLDSFGIECSTGSACSSHSLLPSHVVLATGVPVERAHGSIRFSLGSSATRSDVDYAVSALVESASRLRAMSSLTCEGRTFAEKIL
jgi:cysteine desulfurase